jgi:CHAP domain
MTFDEFIAKWTGKGCDFDGKYKDQCVDLYRMYVKEVVGGLQSAPVVGAADIWETYNKDTFTRVENTRDGIPPKGSVIIWGRTYGPYGHVGIAIEGTTSSFKAFSQNDPSNSLPSIKTYRSYKGVLGWLIPKGIMNSDEIAVKKTDFEKLVSKSSGYDSLLNLIPATDVDNAKAVIGGIRGRITELEGKLSTAQANENIMSKQVSGLTETLTKVQQKLDLSIEHDKIDEKTIQDLSKSNSDLELKNSQLVNRIETLEKEQLNQSVTLTIADLFKMLWNQKITIKK